MTPAEFKDWRKRLRLTQDAAAAKLGRTKRMVQYYERAAPQTAIPEIVAHLCRAIEAQTKQETIDDKLNQTAK